MQVDFWTDLLLFSFSLKEPMSDAANDRAQTLFHIEPDSVSAPIDALVGDWSDGLRGSLKPLLFPKPFRLGSAPAPTPEAAPSAPRPGPEGVAEEMRTEQADLQALLAMRDKLLAKPAPEPS